MALIADKNIFKQFVPVETSMLPATFVPDVERAEELYILKAIGQEVYDLIAATTPNDDCQKLLKKVRAALAPLAMQLLIPKLNVRVSDGGLHTSSSQEKERALKWQVDDLRNQYLIDGYNALDRLLEYMEAQTAATWYNTWKASSAFTTYKQFFINRASLFEAQGANINNSRWLFIQLLSEINHAEEFFLKPAIGDDFTDYLKDKFKDGTGSDEENQAIKKIQKSVALLAYSRALRNPNFLNEYIVVTATRSDDIRKQENSLANFFRLADDYKNLADGSLSKLKKYLNENASDTVFADYYSSELYVNPDPLRNTKRREGNDRAKGTWFM